jgi:hypothetical protein
MSKHRPLSVVIGVGSAAFLALPIALTSYVGSHAPRVEFPTFHASESGPNWTVTPISDRKAKAVRDFKTTQI